MRIKRTITGAVALAVGAALALAGCSSGSGDASSGSGTPKKGGTLTVAVVGEPVQLNPLVDQTGGYDVTRPLVDSLVWDKGDGEYEPWLASSWKVSDDAKVYTFTIRKGVTFTDGEKLDAAAVATNFNYAADPKNQSTGSVAKLHPSAKALDADTVRITLGQPESSFLTLIAAPYFGIVSPKQITDDPKSLATKVIGTGPFELVSWKKGESLTYKRNPDYDWAPKGFHSGAAYLDKIVYRFIADDSARYSAFTSGQVDAVDEVPVQDIKSTLANSTWSSKKWVLPGVNFQLYFNTKKSPLNDVKVRRALLEGTDRKSIVQAATFGQYPLQGYLASTTPDYDAASAKAIDYDASAAADLLDEAGWKADADSGYREKDGRELALTIPYEDSSSTDKRALELFQSGAKKLGVKVELQPISNSQYYDRLYNGNYDIIASAQSEATAMQVWRLFGSDNIGTDGNIGSNASFVSDPELDALLAKARSSADADDRKRYYAEAQALLPDLAPSIPLYSQVRVFAAQSKVKDVKEDLSWPQAQFFDTWIDD